MNILEIRPTETPALLNMRARLSAAFAETYGEVVGAQIESQVKKLTYAGVERVSKSKAVFNDPAVVRKVLTAAQKKGEFREEVLEHPLFRRLVEQTVAEYPLVSIGSTKTFTTEHMVAAERKMLALSQNESGRHILPEAKVRAAIQTKRGISEEQIGATIAATRSAQDVTVIEGTAGAGKSFTMEAICKAYESCGYEIMGTAISWVASMVLGQSANIKNTRALTGLLNDMEVSAKKPGAEFFNRPTLLVVDEAGMVGTEQMAALLGYCASSRNPVKVVLTGDSLQVMPIAAGAAMETIVAYNKSVRINTIRRQILESHRTAVHRFSRREAGAGLNIFVQQEAIRWAKDEDDQVDMVVRAFLSYRLKNPTGTALALATTNDAVTKINARVRQAYKNLGMIQGEEVEVTVTDTRPDSQPELTPFAVGDEIVLRGNNKDLQIYNIDPHADPLNEKTWKASDRVGVFNRNTGRIVGIRQAKDPLGSYDFVVDLAGEMPGRVIINSETFHKGNNENIRALPMVHNFATTVYGSQGQTVDEVFLLDSKNIDFRYAYVACSRHRKNLTIFLNETDLHRRLDEGQGKRNSAAARNNPDKAVIKLGRYPREEMLREVATTWARDSQNPTAMLYEIRAKLHQGDDMDLEKLGQIRAPSRSESDSIWDSDLRATAFSEVDAPLGMANSWLRGVQLDTDSMIGAVEGMVKLVKWLKVEDLSTDAEDLLNAMNERRPVAGIWDLAGAEDLAEYMRDLAQDCRNHLESRVGLAQEIMDRTRAGDGLSKAMIATVEVLTQRTPEVNVEKILNSDEPLKEAELVRQYEVDLNRSELPSILEIPVDIVPDATAAPQAASEAAQAGFMNRLLSRFAPPPPPPKPTRKHAAVSHRQPDLPSPFEPQPNAFGEFEAPAAVPGDRKKGTGLGLRRVFWRASKEWLLRPPVPTKEVPWYPDVPSVGRIAPNGTLQFENVAKTTGSAQAEGPSDAFLSATQGTWWGRGRLDEPRVFARDHLGEIVSRYALDGRCVAGEGYPPMLRNPSGNKATPIYILPGPHEMAWLAEVKFKKSENGQDPSLTPHMVWAAKDVDWTPIAGTMAKREVFIVRSKKDPSQAEWALALQKRLKEDWNVTTTVYPEITPKATPKGPQNDTESREPVRLRNRVTR